MVFNTNYNCSDRWGFYYIARAKIKLNKIETLKGVILALGLDPNEVLSREAMVKPHRTIIDPTQRQDSDFRILSKTIRKTLIDELKNSRYLSLDSGSPEPILA